MGQKNSKSDELDLIDLFSALDELAAFDQETADNLRQIINKRFLSIENEHVRANAIRHALFKLRIQLSYLQDDTPGVRKCSDETHKALLWLTSEFPLDSGDSFLLDWKSLFPVIILSNGRVYDKKTIIEALHGIGELPNFKNISEYDIALIKNESRKKTLWDTGVIFLIVMMLAMIVTSVIVMPILALTVTITLGLSLTLALGVPTAIGLLAGIATAISDSNNRSNELQPNFRTANLSTTHIFGALDGEPGSTFNFEEYVEEHAQRTLMDAAPLPAHAMAVDDARDDIGGSQPKFS